MCVFVCMSAHALLLEIKMGNRLGKVTAVGSMSHKHSPAPRISLRGLGKFTRHHHILHT